MMNFVKVVFDCVTLVLLMEIFERDAMLHRVKNKAIVVVSLILIGSFTTSCFVENKLVTETLNIFTVLLAVFVLAQLPLKKFLIVYLTSLLVSAIIEEGVYLLIPYLDFVPNKIITMCIIYMIRLAVVNMKRLSISISALPGKLIFVLCVLLLSLVMLLGGISTISDLQAIQETKYLFVLALVAEGAVCITVILGIQLGISKNDLQKENEVLQKYNDQQRKYYELLLKKEEDTRRFRHDFLNHLQCINGLLKEQKIEECQRYIDDMLHEAEKKGRVYCTGNKIADIILTSSLSKLEKTIEVKVFGRLKDKLNISDYDLCIVISNLVNNAVEAVNEQNNSKAFIHITFTTGKRFIKIEVKNSLSGKQIASALSLQTRKHDRKLHGLGLKNVRMIVEKYDGKLEFDATEEEFRIFAILNLSKDQSGGFH